MTNRNCATWMNPAEHDGESTKLGVCVSIDFRPALAHPAAAV